MTAERTVAIGRTRVRFVEAGDGAGDPLLLVHGLGSGMVRWRDLIPHLARVRRTVALDLPGFGASDAPPGPYSPAWLAGALRAFMDAVGIERALLVGNSLGGLVAIWFAAAWPQRTSGLALLAPALPNEGPPASRRVVLGALVPAIPVLGDAVFRRSMRRPADTLVRETLERNCADPARVAPGTVDAMLEEMRARQRSPDHLRAAVAANRALVWAVTARRAQTWRVAASVRVPVVLLWGDRDLLMPVHIGSRAVERIPGAHLVILDETGHNPQLERPAELAGALVAFARAVEARG